MDLISIKDKIEKMKRCIQICSNSIDGQNYTHASYLLGAMHENCDRILEKLEEERGIE